RLDRGDSEVLLARQDEGATARHQSLDLVIGKVSGDFDGGPRARAQVGLPGPRPDHDQRQLSPVARLDDVIEAFVGVEARHCQEEPLVAYRITIETPGLDRRINDDRAPAVRLLD